MKRLASVLVVAALAGCAADPHRLSPGMSGSDVSATLGKPVATGRLAGGQQYWDYSRQPFGFSNERVTFSPDGRVREVRNLLTEENFGNLQKGMTPEEVRLVVGPSARSGQRQYAGGTNSWTYRYKDVSVIKLLHVIFDSTGRLQWHYTEWDPGVYSKGGGGKDSSR